MLRISPRTVHVWGTMLVPLPPSTSPKFTVVSGATRPLGTAVTARAAASRALMPCSGAKPAWDARPVTAAVKPKMVGAATTAAPKGPS